MFLFSHSALVLAVKHTVVSFSKQESFRLKSVRGAATLVYFKLKYTVKIIHDVKSKAGQFLIVSLSGLLSELPLSPCCCLLFVTRSMNERGEKGGRRATTPPRVETTKSQAVMDEGSGSWFQNKTLIYTWTLQKNIYSEL